MELQSPGNTYSLIVARLAANIPNIPLFKANFSPLSFLDVPADLYKEAILGVYELQNFDLLRDVFVWAYQRSAKQYVALRQSIGEPDAFKLRYRSQLQEIVFKVITTQVRRKDLRAYLDAWASEHIAVTDRAHLADAAEAEVVSLHEGNFARYRITPAEYAAWRQAWENA